MAIDYEGNFYFITESQETWEATLVKGKLSGDSLDFVGETSLGEGLADRTDYGSLVYSQENNGLLWADEKNLIHWIDLSTWEDLRIITTGRCGRPEPDSGEYRPFDPFESGAGDSGCGAQPGFHPGAG